jgi:large subunit ribosomal protein L9
MKLLLCKNVRTLGIVGDVVDVAPGYGRNYLLPQGLATEPSQGNVRRLAVARKEAEVERARFRKEMEALAARLKDVEVTIHSLANEEGVLYGSVGRKEIAQALSAEGYAIEADQVNLPRPLRHLDSVMVEIKLAEDLRVGVKVWVVREKSDEDDASEEASGSAAGTEAEADDDRADE